MQRLIYETPSCLCVYSLCPNIGKYLDDIWYEQTNIIKVDAII